MENRGGVGLVFVNDEGGSMFLHVARVVPVLHLFMKLPCLLSAAPTFTLVRMGVKRVKKGLCVRGYMFRCTAAYPHQCDSKIGVCCIGAGWPGRYERDAVTRR